MIYLKQKYIREVYGMKTRKMISAIICLCVVCLLTALLPVVANADTTSGTMANGEGVADAIKWTFDSDTGELIISGSGKMPDFTDTVTDMPWRDLRTGIKSARIESGITKLGGRTFQECKALRSVEIADTVQTVGSYAFNSATAIESVFFKNGLTTLNNAAFNRCASLKTVVLPRSVTTMHEKVFMFTPANMVIKVYENSPAYAWLTDNDGAKNSFQEIPTGKDTNTPFVPRTVETVSEDDISLTYTVGSKTASIINYGAERDTVAVFASLKNNTLRKIDMQKITLAQGEMKITAADDFDQPGGSETKVMLLESALSLRPLCTNGGETIVPNLHLAGDSIMCKWPDDRYGQQGWGEPLRALFGDGINVTNDAVSGWTAENFYKNKWTAGIRESMKAGDFLMISYLHNDYCISADTSKTNYNPNYKETYTLYLTKLIEEAQANGINVILVLPSNRGISTNFHGDFIEVMPSLAQKYNVPFIDLHAKTLEMLQSDLEGTKKKIYMYKLVEQGIITQEQLENHSNTTLRNNGEDLTHINVNGAKFLADYVAEQLETAAPELAQYLK